MSKEGLKLSEKDWVVIDPFGHIIYAGTQEVAIKISELLKDYWDRIKK